jgi:hypothetical protein
MSSHLLDAHADDVLQFGYDQNHSGNNPNETLLGASNVASLQAVYSVAFSGADAPPVFLQHAATMSGIKDVLFVTTVNGVAAIDAASGAPIWVQSTSQFEYSIGASPVIDPGRQFVYGPGSDGRIHKLAVTDGSEVIDANWPIRSSAKPAIEKASSPLAIGTTPDGAHFLYSVTSSFNDNDDYQGHLTAIDLATGHAEIFNAACSDLHIHFVAHGTPGVDDCGTTLNGIWGRAGVTYNPYTNRIYMTTGNGLFDANTGGHNWGDTVLALRPDGTGGNNGLPLDSYTPAEYEDFRLFDEDLGSGSPAVLPPASGSAIAHLGVQIGKDGAVRLLDMDNLAGHGGPGFVGGELQKVALIPGGFGDDATPQPAIWTDVHGDGSTWVFASAQGVMSGLQLTVVNHQPLLEQRWSRGSLSVTSSPIIANDVLYTVTAGSNNATIVALDPASGNLLWTSPAIDRCCHAQNPVVVNGRLYLASGSHVTMFAPKAPAASTSFNPDQHGITGSWYNPATPGQGIEIEVYPDLVGPGQGGLFAGWYTFDVTAAGGQRWYALQGVARSNSQSIDLDIATGYGGNLDAPPVVSASIVGHATLSFADCSAGNLAYTFTDGRTGTVPLTRLTANVTCSASGDNGNQAGGYLLSGSWFDPNTSGQGLIFDINPVQPFLFAGWYTYAKNGEMLGGGASQRWYTLQSGSFTPGATSLDGIGIYTATGGEFGKATATTADKVGTASIVFQGCNALLLSYSFSAGENAGKAGAVHLIRTGPAPVGCSL